MEEEEEEVKPREKLRATGNEDWKGTGDEQEEKEEGETRKKREERRKRKEGWEGGKRRGKSVKRERE